MDTRREATDVPKTVTKNAKHPYPFFYDAYPDRLQCEPKAHRLAGVVLGIGAAQNVR